MFSETLTIGATHIGQRSCVEEAFRRPRDETTFRVPDDRLDEVGRHNLLSVPADQAVRLTLWATIHDFAVLAVDRHLDPDVGQLVLDALRALLLVSTASRDRGESRSG